MKESTCQCRRSRRHGFDPWVSKIHWRRKWQPTPVLLPGKSHGWRNLVGCSPWGHKESDNTEQLHFHFSLSCIGEGNGNPLQCSCFENPRDGGACWAVVYGVAQSRTRLKRLSSSSSMKVQNPWELQTQWKFVPTTRLFTDITGAQEKQKPREEIRRSLYL